MQLTEQHVIRRDDPRFALIDAAAFKSKNLYNAALYEMRQAFIFQGKRLSYEQMDKLMQQHEAYQALPAKVSQQVLRQLAQAWEDYFEACQAYEENPAKFLGHPRLPKYKDKARGRNLLVYTMQAISKRSLKRGIIKPSRLPVEVKTQQDPQQIDQVRIVPRSGYYVVEVIYTEEPVQAQVDPTVCAAIDLGVTNLAAITSNREGFIPRLVNGRPLKARNPSQASFLDLDPIPTYQPDDETEYTFSGKRIGRRNRLYRTKGCQIVCADVNGSYNILRKRRPDAFSKVKGVAAYVVQPLRLAIAV